MRKTYTMRQALEDPDLLGTILPGKTWQAILARCTAAVSTIRGAPRTTPAHCDNSAPNDCAALPLFAAVINLPGRRLY
jgi:hypothetical protein